MQHYWSLTLLLLLFIAGYGLHPGGEASPRHPRSHASRHHLPGRAGLQGHAELLPLGQRPGQVHLPHGTAGQKRKALLPCDHGVCGAYDAGHLYTYSGTRMPEVWTHLQETQVGLCGI